MKKRWLLLVVMLLLAACSSAPVEEPSAEAVPAEEMAEEEPAPAEESAEEKAAEGEAVEPSLTGKIVFTSNREGDPETSRLFVLDTASGEITQVDVSPRIPILPKWSPDGKQVLFTDVLEFFLYKVDVTSGEIVQLTDFRSNNGDWSPDGSRIVFQSNHEIPSGLPDLFVMDADGSNKSQILEAPDTLEFSPRWSNDASQVLFVSEREGQTNLFVLGLADESITQITDLDQPVTEIAWSPDGSRIVYAMGENPGQDLYVIDAAGESEPVRLTDDGQFNTFPAFSPDGERIVFKSDAGGQSDLWVVGADGSGLERLTDDEWNDLFPDWGQ